MSTAQHEVELMGMSIAAMHGADVVNRVFDDLRAGRGGWLVTVNLDILRRHHVDETARALYAQADLRIADGMPLVWASRLMGAAVPERIAGATLAEALAARAAREGRSLYLLGGAPGTADGASATLRARHPDLRIAGTSSPVVSSPPTASEVRAVAEELWAAQPDLLLVGMGSPKQEHLIRALRAILPQTWMIGVGGTFSFLAGEIRRAPLWAQRAGFEWLHRLIQEPRRLAARYLVDGLPFAAVLFGSAIAMRALPARQRTPNAPRSLPSIVTVPDLDRGATRERAPSTEPRVDRAPLEVAPELESTPVVGEPPAE